MVCVDLLHEVGPDGQGHGGALSHAHGVEVYVAILASYPAAADELWGEAYEPGVGVAVGCSGLSAYFAFDVVLVAQSSGGAVVDHSAQHLDHLVGAFGADDLVHAWLEVGDDVAFVVLDACDEERGGAYAVVGEGCVGADHLGYRHLAGAEAERHGGVYVGVVDAEVVEQGDELLGREFAHEVG